MTYLSHAEENYLKAMYHLSVENDSVSTNALAASMQTTPASANDMLKRLTQKGLTAHVKYKGAHITASGKKVALQVIRKHRLWEVFLVDKLNFQWDEVHELAEQLEHIRSPLLTDRLDDFLGNPRLDPHGDPIPDKNGVMPEADSVPMTKLQEGDEGVLTSVGNDDSALLQYLDSIQLRPGVKVSITKVIPFDASYEIRTKIEDRIFISNKVAELLMITKTERNG